MKVLCSVAQCAMQSLPHYTGQVGLPHTPPAFHSHIYPLEMLLKKFH